MEKTVEYITSEGETWFTIAHKAYGSANLFPQIVIANPDVPITDRLPGGISLQIPVIESILSKTDEELLPPWKKNL